MTCIWELQKWWIEFENLFTQLCKFIVGLIYSLFESLWCCTFVYCVFYFDIFFSWQKFFLFLFFLSIILCYVLLCNFWRKKTQIFFCTLLKAVLFSFFFLFVIKLDLYVFSCFQLLYRKSKISFTLFLSRFMLGLFIFC